MSWGYQTWLMDILSDEFRGSKGFRVDYIDGWETRGYKNFSPIGVIDHHTGRGAYNALLSYMCFNSSIAPLCNTSTSRVHNGIVRITVVAAGKANHAGRGNLWWTGLNNGNYRSLGRENQNSGSQSWPKQQLEAIYRCDAAELRYMNRDTGYLDFHKTYAEGRKVDPVHLNLNAHRREVNSALAPKPVDPWEEFMAEKLTDKEADALKAFAGYITENVRGDRPGWSFPHHTLKFLREEQPELAKFVSGMDEMNTKPGSLAEALVAIVREARARGWEVDPDAFRENVHYRYTPGGHLQSRMSEDEPWKTVVTEES